MVTWSPKSMVNDNLVEVFIKRNPLKLHAVATIFINGMDLGNIVLNRGNDAEPFRALNIPHALAAKLGVTQGPIGLPVEPNDAGYRRAAEIRIPDGARKTGESKFR